eukprot:TRINITY_DN2326_c0_g1_i2.p1 TRINITY_DN2326_c0_g1~~TRINITY_DN2326_c0_g1_i2.p1  ORF type:complete len:585 (+),score=132.59 TRINITY_DN2326_c0_g1_i2:201-1757(+)
MLATEKSYVAGLKFVVTNYMEPMKQPDHPFHRLVPNIFQNLEEVLDTSELLLAKLRPRIEGAAWDKSQCIADVFLEMIPRFSCYNTYMENHHIAIRTVNRLLATRVKFAQFAQSVKEMHGSEGRDLLTFLITPVQRVLRYSLLFKDYLKHTSPSLFDYPMAKSANAALEMLAEAVNDSIRKEQNMNKLYEIRDKLRGLPKPIQQHIVSEHAFIREGSLMKMCKKKPKKRMFFLFSDSIVYAAIVQTVTGPLYSFRRIMYLKKARVKPLSDSADIINAFQISTEQKSFFVMADSPKEKDFWVMDLTQILKGERKEVKDQHFMTDKSDASEAPVWVPDKFAVRCMICGDFFNVVKRRHHCRNCGKLVCSNCCSKRRPLLGSELPERVCLFCYDLLELQEQGSIPAFPTAAPAKKAELTTPNGSPVQCATPPRLQQNRWKHSNSLMAHEYQALTRNKSAPSLLVKRNSEMQLRGPAPSFPPPKPSSTLTLIDVDEISGDEDDFDDSTSSDDSSDDDGRWYH